MREEEEETAWTSRTYRLQAKNERQHLAALEDLGLEDGDEALQYALMLSMEEQGQSGSAYRGG